MFKQGLQYVIYFLFFLENVETENSAGSKKMTLMTFQKDGPVALLETANISIEQRQSWKVYMILFSLKNCNCCW